MAGDTRPIPAAADPLRCDVYGAGGHGQVVRDVLAACGIAVRWQYDDDPGNQHPASRDVRPGIRLVGPALRSTLDLPVVLAVGRNAERAELTALLGTTFARAVHPSAIIAPTAVVGTGSVVLHGAVVQAHARLGRQVLVNTAASVDHDCTVGDFAHISPRAALCGHVSVGEGTHIGVGAVVIPKVRIGRWCRVGAGAVVLHDLPDRVTAVGNPARVLDDRAGEPRPDLQFVARPR
jgi:sugar O-acyltransferase (sialic acid O-acetyltransferase NeuD family)